MTSELWTLSVKPPNDPWKPIQFSDKPRGNLAFYYSDDLSRLPVREVTRPGDNKADPNLETGSYGLFTTCCRRLRSATVGEGRRWLFFTTRRDDRRVLTGVYILKWWTPQPAGGDNDFALAAESMHFVEEPIPLHQVDELLGTDYSDNAFRQHRVVDCDTCLDMASLLRRQADATDLYIEEIQRLQRFNMARGGYRNISLGQETPFTWEDAESILADPHPAAVEEDLSNQSPTGKWKCRNCGGEIKNKARLRRCRQCGAIGTLEPINND